MFLASPGSNECALTVWWLWSCPSEAHSPDRGNMMTVKLRDHGSKAPVSAWPGYSETRDNVRIYRV